MPRNLQNKEIRGNQLSIDFNIAQPKNESFTAKTAFNGEAKILNLDYRKEIYQRILNRSMK